MQKSVVALFLLLAGAVASAQAPGGGRAVPPPVVEPELPASDLLVRYQSPTLRFRWSLAPEAALEPALVRDLRSTALANRERAIRAADATAEAAAKTGRPAGRPLQSEWIERWVPQAETDLLLALSAQQYSFTGGAHGNLVLKSVLWDRGENRRITFLELFADPKAMLAALKPLFCNALDEARKSRRDGELGEGFADCPDPSAYPIVPEGEGQIDRIRILVPPYEAGPWVEGVYEISLPAAVVRPYLLPRYNSVFTAP